jgi:hypothetical protein
MYTQTLSVPQFFLFAKRRSRHEPVTTIYAKITYQKKVHEKSMNITCPYDSWDNENMFIRGCPVETNQLKLSYEELKQKVMGAYYVLQQQNPDFTLHDIIDLASGSRTPGLLSDLIRTFLFENKELLHDKMKSWIELLKPSGI